MPCFPEHLAATVHVQYKSATHCRGTTEKGKGGRHPTIPEGACSPVRPAPISRPERRSHFRCEGSILLALASFLLAFLLLRPSFAAAFSCSGLLSLRPSLAPAFFCSRALLPRSSTRIPGRWIGLFICQRGCASTPPTPPSFDGLDAGWKKACRRVLSGQEHHRSREEDGKDAWRKQEAET